MLFRRFQLYLDLESFHVASAESWRPVFVRTLSICAVGRDDFHRVEQKSAVRRESHETRMLTMEEGLENLQRPLFLQVAAAWW